MGLGRRCLGRKYRKLFGSPTKTKNKKRGHVIAKGGSVPGVFVPRDSSDEEPWLVKSQTGCEVSHKESEDVNDDVEEAAIRYADLKKASADQFKAVCSGTLFQRLPISMSQQ